MADYLTPEQARERWAREKGLPIDMAPKFPEGTREYAEYAEQLGVALYEFRNG